MPLVFFCFLSLELLQVRNIFWKYLDYDFLKHGMSYSNSCVVGCFKHTQTVGKSIVSDLAPRDKSHVLGNFNAFGSMGFIIGPTVGAHLVEQENGFQSVCFLAAAAFIVNVGKCYQNT